MNINLKRRTSKIWKLNKDALESIVKKSSSISEILRNFGLENKGGNHKTLKQRLLEDSIDFSHIPLGPNSNKGRKFPNSKKIPLEKILVKESNFSKTNLKKRLLKEKILTEKCDKCGLKPVWENKLLVLQLDHKNGDSKDHRLKNLGILCPNCHSQTKTFAGKRFKKARGACKNCGDPVSKNTQTSCCLKCTRVNVGIKNRKVKNRPTQKELKAMTGKYGFCWVGRKYGVSDNAIRKWLK